VGWVGGGGGVWGCGGGGGGGGGGHKVLGGGQSGHFEFKMGFFPKCHQFTRHKANTVNVLIINLFPKRKTQKQDQNIENRSMKPPPTPSPATL